MTDRPELVHVPPGELTTTRNVRRDLELDPGFVASITEHGVLVPIVATRADDGSLAIAYGHRRAAAAAQVGLTTVPVVVVPANDEATRTAAQLVENQHRTALTLADEVAAHEQLAALGVPLAEAARATGMSHSRVKAMRSLADADRGQLEQMDLETALVLDEFDDPAARQQLADAYNSRGRWELMRQAQQIRDSAALDLALQGERRHWLDQGFAVVERGDTTAVAIDQLLGPDGQPLQPDEHASCPGRAVMVSGWRADDVRAREYCADPEGSGHTLPDWMATRRTAQQSQQQHQDPDSRADADRERSRRAERTRVISTNQAWRAAEPVRRQHVAEWLRRTKPGPQIVRWALQQLLTTGLAHNPHQLLPRLRDLGWADDVLTSRQPGADPVSPLLRMPDLAASDRATGPRAVMGIIAIVLADRELATGVQSWRTADPASATAAYLRFLADHTGYDLGAAERLAARLPDPAQQSRGAGRETGLEETAADPMVASPDLEASGRTR